MLVHEREHLTLNALLVTPVTMSEVLLAKAVLGFLLVTAMSYIALALNGVLDTISFALVVTLAVAAIVCVEIGLLYGTLAKDAKSLYTLVKTLNIFLAGPVIFYLFPDWSRWVAKVFPTYWLINPLYEIVFRGASLADVRGDLAVAAAIGVVLLAPIVLLARRLQERVAAA
jgi:ABC-2 type transport system permease protein